MLNANRMKWVVLRAYPNNSEQVLGSTTCGYSILVEPKI